MTAPVLRFTVAHDLAGVTRIDPSGATDAVLRARPDARRALVRAYHEEIAPRYRGRVLAHHEVHEIVVAFRALVWRYWPGVLVLVEVDEPEPEP